MQNLIQLLCGILTIGFCISLYFYLIKYLADRTNNFRCKMFGLKNEINRLKYEMDKLNYDMNVQKQRVDQLYKIIADSYREKGI